MSKIIKLSSVTGHFFAQQSTDNVLILVTFFSSIVMMLGGRIPFQEHIHADVYQLY